MTLEPVTIGVCMPYDIALDLGASPELAERLAVHLHPRDDADGRFMTLYDTRNPKPIHVVYWSPLLYESVDDPSDDVWAYITPEIRHAIRMYQHGGGTAMALVRLGLALIAEGLKRKDAET